eukprot:CAMPEP_0172828508 /NCGR_PEP_ID=MMETSP1075-20121228/20886_1 /TAXON_ID=2916 /ORGANISM="Ceratium fusus, Strain PA161109" /LENGTH=153 /DNA_ID=CAMNT_0013670511 /DNA_START=64 /DNA_END=526 /DNA_ORIENTATION=-
MCILEDTSAPGAVLRFGAVTNTHVYEAESLRDLLCSSSVEKLDPCLHGDCRSAPCSFLPAPLQACGSVLEFAMQSADSAETFYQLSEPLWRNPLGYASEVHNATMLKNLKGLVGSRDLFLHLACRGHGACGALCRPPPMLLIASCHNGAAEAA